MAVWIILVDLVRVAVWIILVDLVRVAVWIILAHAIQCALHHTVRVASVQLGNAATGGPSITDNRSVGLDVLQDQTLQDIRRPVPDHLHQHLLVALSSLARTWGE